MLIAQVVTTQPQDRVVEYQIVDTESPADPDRLACMLSHGHLVEVEFVPDQTGTDVQTVVATDAILKGLHPSA